MKNVTLNTMCFVYSGSEADDDEMTSEFEDSNDSWTTPEEFSSEFILRYGSKYVYFICTAKKIYLCMMIIRNLTSFI